MKKPIVGEPVIYGSLLGTFLVCDEIKEINCFGDTTDCRTLWCRQVLADYLHRFTWSFTGPVIVDWRDHDPRTALVLRR